MRVSTTLSRAPSTIRVSPSAYHAVMSMHGDPSVPPGWERLEGDSEDDSAEFISTWGKARRASDPFIAVNDADDLDTTSDSDSD